MGIRRRFGRFYLDSKPDLLGQLPLMYEYTYGGYYDENGKHVRYRIRHYTGFKIPGKKITTKKGTKFAYWDDLQQYAKGFIDAEEINGYVMALINRVSKYVRHKKENFEPVDISEVKRLITVNHSVSHENVVSYCEAYLNRYNKPGQESTKRNLNTMVSSLKEYTENRPPLLANVGKEFLENFISYLIITKKNNNTTVEKKLSMLQQILREAYKQGLLTNKSALEEVKISRGSTDIIFLKEDELQHLESFKPKSERLEKVKDVFLFGCYTGLRYSDLEQLNQAHYSKKKLKGEQYHILSFVIKKTRRTHEIALPPKAVTIVNKYWDKQENKRLLPVPTNQKINDYIKELCEDADIDTEIEITAQFGSEVRTEIKKKFEIISCHSARHT
ncbi:site-specific integrase [Mucilaginibacter sp. Bleaf8]|uniref:site-specific integrase n=1 Tax=Mucilaginibacter sp. Bleaf8 TaxID=2834430 RepID=UPI001BCC6986|nr:site-specific integrase [Mucilaginibacter sp. Bleaf8]MBS7566847.1 site-specific integrase [Mucilaginibacter sp. Bleaf8]